MRNMISLAAIGMTSLFSVTLPSQASAQLEIQEVCTTVMTACVAPSTRAPLRRGTTEKIKIRGPFVDHTSKNQVISGAPADVHVEAAAGYNCGSVGCLDITLRVDPDFNLTSRNVNMTITNLFGTKSFGLLIVRKGEITGMTQAPDPAAWGETVRIVITGNDIGNTRASVSQSGVFNEVEATSLPQVGTARYDVVGSGNQPGTSSSIILGDDAIAGIAGQYRFAIPRRTVNYRSASQVASCATTPGITAPALQSPLNNQVFTFTTNPLQAVITLRWGAGQTQFKTNERWIVEVGPPNQAPVSATTAEGILQRSFTLNRNTTYQWRVRAWNCNAPLGPFSAYSQFVVQ